MFISGKACYRAYSPLSPGGDIPPPGGHVMLFYGELRTHTDATSASRRAMQQTIIEPGGCERGVVVVCCKNHRVATSAVHDFGLLDSHSRTFPPLGHFVEMSLPENAENGSENGGFW